jgi:ketosteroid isomerase-like protein
MDDLTKDVLALEEERCNAIVAQDWDRLAAILSDSLIHTHTRGNCDSRDSYLQYLQGKVEILSLQREGLRVVPVGKDVAVMHGKQVNRARLRGDGDSATISVEAMATQVWAREADGRWRLVAFHATSLGAPPPAVVR